MSSLIQIEAKKKKEERNKEIQLGRGARTDGSPSKGNKCSWAIVTQMAARYSPKLVHNTGRRRAQGPPGPRGRSAEQHRRRHGGAKPPAQRGVRGGVRPPLPHPLRRPCWFWKPEHRRRRSGLSIPPPNPPAALLPVLTRIEQALPTYPAAVFSTVALLSTPTLPISSPHRPRTLYAGAAAARSQRHRYS